MEFLTNQPSSQQSIINHNEAEADRVFSVVIPADTSFSIKREKYPVYDFEGNITGYRRGVFTLTIECGDEELETTVFSLR